MTTGLLQVLQDRMECLSVQVQQLTQEKEGLVKQGCSSAQALTDAEKRVAEAHHEVHCEQGVDCMPYTTDSQLIMTSSTESH